MKIKKLQILNFEGFNGKFEYEFKDTVNAICLRNGAGKTSFLNALRYAITGAKPVGNMINSNCGDMAVGLTFHDGTGIIRQDYSDNRSGRCFVNGRPVSKKNLDEILQSRAGVNQGTMKIATSTDVLAGLKPHEFGELLLSYIPESLTKENLFGFLGHISEEEKKLIEDFFPDDTFGTEVVDAFYKHLFELRKALNKKISECEAYLNNFVDVPATDKSEEELQAMLDEFSEKQGSVNLYKEQKKAYDEALKRKSELENNIKVLEKNIADIGDVKANEELLKDLKEKLSYCMEQKETVDNAISSLDTMMKTLRKALSDIEKPVCPLSEKLKCTTDKSVIRNEIEDSIKSGEKSLEKQQNYKKKIDDAIIKINAGIEEYNKGKNLLIKKESYIEQLSEKKKELSELTIPSEPKMINSEDYKEKINLLVNTLAVVKSNKDIIRVKTYLESVRPMLGYYNELLKMFAPKGVVKEKIVEYYLSEFENQCNIKAKELNPGMSLKFVSDSGISVLADMNGSFSYESFDNLSGGERSFVLFLLLDMINSLTGLRMMFLDELSVLDKESFETLVKLIKKYEDEYDLIIMAAAEHDDNIATLNKYEVNLIEF